MIVATIRKIASACVMQNLSVPDNTTFYSFKMNSDLYATVFTLEDTAKNRFMINRIQDTELYALPSNVLLIVMRSLQEPIKRNAVDRPPQFGHMYIKLCPKDDMGNIRECVKIGQFFGRTFKVLRVSKRNVCTGEKHLSMSSEYMPLKSLFKSQLTFDKDERMHIVSEFITEKEFTDYCNDVINEMSIV